LSANISLAQPGDQVELKVWHKGAMRTLHAVLGDATTPAVPAQTVASKAPNPTERLGLLLSAPKLEDKHEMAAAPGLLIDGVNGPAERAGIQVGDVLLAINGEPINSIAQAGAAAVRSAKSVALLLQRDGMKIYIPLRLG
jgi:serine protease Do